jgi:hypothetical protein
MKAKRNKNSFPNTAKTVKDCKSLEEFYDKYYRRDRYHNIDPCIKEDILISSHSNLFKSGYAGLSHHSSVTGETVYFIPTNVQMKEMKRHWNDKVLHYELDLKTYNEKNPPKKKANATKGKRRRSI